MVEKTEYANEEALLTDHLASLANTTWIGEGKDTFPMPNAPVITAYIETMTMGQSFQTINGDPNTGQKLLCIHYFTRLDNAQTGVPMHQETGYWMLSYADNTFRKAVSIPRGIGILAGGTYDLSAESGLVMTANADAGSPTYGVLNEPYLNMNAQTQSFSTKMTQTSNTYSYFEDSVLNIMGQQLNHTDEAVLTLQV